MRILDEDLDRPCNSVSLFLTNAEARELRDKLEALIAEPIDRHEHVMSDDSKKEITVCVYHPTTLDRLHERAKKLIQFDQ